MERAIDKLEPFQRAIAKAHLASAGVDLEALDTKPLIAIANSWNEICPGHEPLRKLAEEVKKANGRMVSYKAVGSIKLRTTEFPKNTSRKITRFAIDKSID